MKKFYSFVSNGVYGIGCNGSTVFVFDKNGTELAKFKDLPYAYDCAISPKGDIFVVKTTEGRLAVYSLQELHLIKKFRFSKVDEMQDDGFCFSSDGEIFYNIERHTDGCKTALSIYDAKDFSLKKRLFADDYSFVLNMAEYDVSDESVYLIGFYRKKFSGVAYNFFVAKLDGDELSDIRHISEDEYDFCVSYKKTETDGFTESAKELWGFRNNEKGLNSAREQNYSIAKLWKSKGESQ